MNKKLTQLMDRPRLSNLPLLLVAALSISSTAFAGDVLFVSDSETDAKNIPDVLSGGTTEVPHASIPGAGFRPAFDDTFHDVTIIRDDYEVTGGTFGEAEGTNPTLTGDLSNYCSVFWSASGPHEPLGLTVDRIGNGGFEDIAGTYAPNATNNYMRVPVSNTSLTGWTIIQPVAWGVNPTDGNSASAGQGFVDLSGIGNEFSGEIHQTLATESTKTYELSIDRQGEGSIVSLNGTDISLTAGATSGSWTTYTATFTAISATTTLSIRKDPADTSGIVFIDNITFTLQSTSDAGLGADGGLHTNAAVFTNLMSYVSTGGFVFVTGHDAITHPHDISMIEFIGGPSASAAQQVNPDYSIVSGLVTAITNGTQSVTGTPANSGINQVDGVREQDYLVQGSDPNVTVLVTDSEPGINPPAVAWSVRHPFGAADDFVNKGHIAYVANGVFFYRTVQGIPPTTIIEVLSNGEDPSWLVPNSPYRNALLNFAETSCESLPFDETETPVAHDQSVSTSLNDPVGITLTGFDPNGDALAFSIVSFPAFGAVTGTPPVLTYTPDGTNHGDFVLTFVVSDAERTSDPGTVTITVLPNTPPVADANGPYVVDEGDFYTLDGSGSVDPDSDPLTYTWDIDNDGLFGDATGVTPTLSAAGLDDSIVTITLRVSDGSATDETSTTLTVLNVAPVVDAGVPAVINEGDTFSGAGSFADPGALDTWSGTADYGDGSPPQALALNPDGSFSFSHVYTDDGTYVVTATVVDDDSGASSDSATVTVMNVAPAVDAGPDATIAEGAVFLSAGSFTDPGADTWGGIADYGDGSPPQPLALNPDGSFALSHLYADDGAFIVTVEVTDDDFGTGTDTATVVVENVPPLVDAGPDTVIDEGSMFVSAGSAVDPGADTLTGTVDYGDGTAPQALVIEPDGSVALSHTYVDNSVYVVTVVVTDDDGGASADTATVTVNNVAPAVEAGPDAVINEGETFTSAGSFSDPGADTWVGAADYGDGSPPQSLTLNPDGSFALSHVYADNGAYVVTVEVTDDDGGVGTDTAIVTVNNVAPATDAGLDATINEGDAFTSTGSFSDPGADTWVAFADYGDGSPPQALALQPDKRFALSHTYANDGEFTVVVTVTDDDGDSGSDSAIVTVVNVPPTVAADLPIVEVNEADIAGNSGTFADVGTDVVTLSASIGAISPLQGQGGTWSWIFTTADGPDQTQTVAITAMDEDGASTTTMFELVVDNVPPVAADDAYSTAEDTLLTIAAKGVLANDTDVGIDLLAAAVATPPTSGTLTLNPDGSFSYMPNPNYFGPDSFTYMVTDDDGATDIGTVTLDVTPVNDPPVLSVDIATQTVQYSDGISAVTITAADVDDVLPLSASLSYTTLPASLSVVDGVCAIDDTVPAGTGSSCFWTLGGNMTEPAGTYPVTFTVNDAAADFDTASTEVVVVQEDATGLMDVDNPTAVIVDDDGSDSSEPFSLTVFVSETLPDLATNGLMAAGDIGLANVTMDLAPVGPGSPVTPTSCALPIVTGTDYTGELEVTCNFIGAPVNTYSVNVTIDGDYYTGSTEDVITVYDPSLGFATGGGWFYWPDTMDKTNYGFTMKYGKNGRNAKGNLLIIRHMADGSIYRFKSNALEGLAVGESDDPAFGWATFSGKGTYKEPGWLDPIGNHTFTTYVEDHGEPGAGVDRVWVEVRDKSNLVLPGLSIDPQATDNAVLINGGNIVVPHTNSGGKK